MKVDSYFGGCPQCGKNDGYINIHREHWFYCADHKTKWCVGGNLFSNWKGQTADQQFSRFEELRFDIFTEVKPLPPTRVFRSGDIVTARRN